MFWKKNNGESLRGVGSYHLPPYMSNWVQKKARTD